MRKLHIRFHLSTYKAMILNVNHHIWGERRHQKFSLKRKFPTSYPADSVHSSLGKMTLVFKNLYKAHT